MIVQTLVVGPLETNCYIVACEKTLSAVVIDPGFEGQDIVAQIDRMGLHVVAIVNTHGHGDHVMANDQVRDRTSAKVMIHRDDAGMLETAAKDFAARTGLHSAVNPVDLVLDDGSAVEAGGLKLVTIHTPGHSPGSCCISCESTLFSGDTLFAGSVGRTDLPGGSRRDLVRSLSKLMTLPDDTRVLPGHGPETTIGEERLHNPFTRMVVL